MGKIKKQKVSSISVFFQNNSKNKKNNGNGGGKGKFRKEQKVSDELFQNYFNKRK